MSPELVPLVAAAPLLVAMAVIDFARMRIPNALVLAMLGLFAVLAPFALAPPDIGLRLAVAALVMLAGIAAFAGGFVAGGDVKGLSALMLFVPPAQLSTFGFTLAAAMLAGIGAILALRARGPAAPGGPAALAERRGYPMGISIALAGLALPLLAALPA